MKLYDFVYEPLFDRAAKGVLTESDLAQIEEMLIRDPHAGEVIPNTNGARKVRIPLSGRGKSGGGRVIYVFVQIADTIHLLLCYPKNVRDNLTSDQQRRLRAVITGIKEEYQT